MARIRPFATYAVASALLACGGGGGSGSGGGTEDTGDAGSSTSEPEARPDPEILAAPDEVARGGWLYVMTDVPVFQLDLELDGRLLDGPRLPLLADMPGVMVRLPEDVPLGEASLVVRFREAPGAFAEHPLAVVEPRLSEVGSRLGLAPVHDATGSPMECAESHTGLAFGDYDGDGDPDAFVGHVGRGGQLFRNEGDGDGDGLPEFEDVTEAAGLSGIDSVAMATFIDLEGDGDLDLFIGRRGTNRLLRNRQVPEGVAEFEDVTEAMGLGVHDQRTMGVAFGDYDGDDDLDLYVVDHAYCFPQNGHEIRAGDHLYRNDGSHFVERTIDIDDPILESVGFSAAWIDIERDGDLDLVVINDDVGGAIGNPNALWRNDGPGEEPGRWSFTEVGKEAGVALPGVNGMGLAYGDLDGDGFVDLTFTNIGDNVVLLGAGDGTFIDVSEEAGIQRRRLPWDRQSITWAPHLWDHDNDGDLDLYFSGGRIKGMAPIPDAFFDNRGDGTFEDLTWSSGLADPGHGKGSALVDLDQDGAWELATAVWGEPLRVYRNDMPDRDPGHHWLDVELRGRGGNRAAIGAIVELRTDGGRQTCFHSGNPSLGGGGEPRCHFGLGPHDRVLELRVVWPDGTTMDPEPPMVDRRVVYAQE